jgi:two-component system alkaline phosphatase synthesis response regulator PhoP
MEALFKGKKILIIEDERSMLRALVAKFEREGFVTTTATDGKLGLELALTEKPDLILLDVMMPKIDGIAVLKQLRNDSVGTKRCAWRYCGND